MGILAKDLSHSFGNGDVFIFFGLFLSEYVCLFHLEFLFIVVLLDVAIAFYR